jgi:protein SCO1/2
MSRRWMTPGLIVGSLVAIGAIALGMVAHRLRQQPPTETDPVVFSLTASDGTPLSEREVIGRPTLVYFGYTFCPDICPTELGWMARVLRELGDTPAQALFVSVDPERDTPAKLGAYASLFDPRIRACTGSAEQLAAAGAAFGAVWRKAEVVTQQPGYYLIDHTMTTIVLDRHGRIAHRLQSHDITPNEAARLIRSLP